MNNEDYIKFIQFRISLEHDLKESNYYDLFNKYIEIFSQFKLEVSKELPHNWKFYRARLGMKIVNGAIDDCDQKLLFPFSQHEILAPPPNIAKAGRFNRENVSFLYLSNDIETCISEIKPEINQMCSLAEFKNVKDGKYLNLYDNSEEDELKFLSDLLLKPVNTDSKKEYLITQFISDVIRKMNFDGILFKSTLTHKANIVCFNPDKFELIKYSERSFMINAINYSFVENTLDYIYNTEYGKLLNTCNMSEEEEKEKTIEYYTEIIDHSLWNEINKYKEKNSINEKVAFLEDQKNKHVNWDGCCEIKLILSELYLDKNDFEKAILSAIEAKKFFNDLKVEKVLAKIKNTVGEIRYNKIYSKIQKEKEDEWNDIISIGNGLCKKK